MMDLPKSRQVITDIAVFFMRKNSFSNGEQQEQQKMVIDIPGMEEHPNAHEVRCPIEAVEPQRVTLIVFILGHDDREKIYH